MLAARVVIVAWTIAMLGADSSQALAAGSTGASFLELAAGPRAVGMGEAQGAVGGDAYAAYWNPAGLAELRQPELAAAHTRSFAGVEHQYLSLAWPLGYRSTLNANLTRLGMDSFDGFDAQGARSGTVDAADHAVGVAYAQTMRGNELGHSALSLGAGLKGIEERLGPVTARTFAA